MQYYLDMIDTARRALERRDASRATLAHWLPVQSPMTTRTNGKGEGTDRRAWPEGDDDGPDTWSGLFV
jgi:hypothetical protein